jgi:hypothetical protein
MMTFSIMTFSIMTFSITTFSITSFSITTMLLCSMPQLLENGISLSVLAPFTDVTAYAYTWPNQFK